MIDFEPVSTFGTCNNSGTKQSIPNLDDARRVNIYDRARL